MKPLVERILRAGLVDQSMARLMEKWGALDRGAADIVGQQKISTEEEFKKFADDIEGLIEKDTEDKEKLKETRLELVFDSICGWKFDDIGLRFGGLDEMGHLFIGAKGKPPIRGARVLEDEKGQAYRVLEVDEVYKNDKLVAYQLTIEKE